MNSKRKVYTSVTYKNRWKNYKKISETRVIKNEVTES